MLTFTTSDRYFDNLVSFLAAISCLGNGFEAQRNGIAHPYSPTCYVTLEGMSSVTGIEFRFFPHALMNTLASNSWPTQIQIDDRLLSKPSVANLQWLQGLTGVHGSMIEAMFIGYFEAVRPMVEANHTKTTTNWPAIWNFGRVVRNACAHKGKICFDNMNASSVTWKTLTYAPSNNGKQVLYSDMTAVEIILLMREMDVAV